MEHQTIEHQGTDKLDKCPDGGTCDRKQEQEPADRDQGNGERERHVEMCEKGPGAMRRFAERVSGNTV
jgi:hypothetical protein